MFYAKKDISDLFEKGIFSYKGNVFKTKEEKSRDESEDESGEELEEESEEESEKERVKKFIEYVEKKSKDLNYDLFKNYFNFVVPSSLAKKLYETKNKNKNNELVEEIKNRWNNLKDEIKKMSEDEKEIEQPDKILKIVEEILEFNKQNQSGKGLKILTPNQMLSRLPITLAQLKAGNNSEKLKNKIRQLLYSL